MPPASRRSSAPPANYSAIPNRRDVAGRCAPSNRRRSTMSVDAETVEQLRSMAAALPGDAGGDLTPLESIPEVVGYVIACARQEGRDELQDVELVVRGAEISPADLRRAEAVLRPLGYVAVADRLRQIAGRRKHTLRPLS